MNDFNNSHPSIKFTKEDEDHECLSFLDVLVVRKADGSAATRLFHKKTWNGQYTNFYSFVPMAYKRNLIRGLTNRLRKISSPEHLDADMLILKKALIENGYPEAFTEQCANLRQDDNRDENNIERLIIKLKFQGDAAAEILRKKIERSLQHNSSMLIPTQTKDRLAVMSTPSVVYQYTFNTCQ